jgi:hypothetical protein
MIGQKMESNKRQGRRQAVAPAQELNAFTNDPKNPQNKLAIEWSIMMYLL